jgi:uncharacterized protein
VRAGFQVAAADLFADADLCRIATATQIDRYPGGLLDWLKRLSPSPTAWMYTGALENHAKLVDEMAEVARLWGNGGAVLQRVRSAQQLAEFARRNRICFPEVCSLPTDLPNNGSWLEKTGRSAGGGGVRTFTGQPPITEGVFYQRRLSGMPYSAAFVAKQDEAMLIGVVRQLVGESWLSAGEFQYCGSVGPAPVSESVQAEIERIGRVLAQEFRLVGLFGVDLMIDREQVWLIEVNPRYTSSMEVLERATGISAIAGHAAVFSNVKPRISHLESTDAIHGKAILFAKRSVAVCATVANWSLIQAAKEPWPALADVPAAGTSIPRCHPVLTVLAESTSAEKTIRILQSRVAKIEHCLYSD